MRKERRGEIVPKETFFHLTDEKKERIMKAAEKEFATNPLKDASIAMIIKDAEIPRGSFYQYFENKEDLYYYYFHTMRQSNFEDLVQEIQRNDGDLFIGFEVFAENMLQTVLKGEHAGFYRNLFLNMDYHAFNRVSPEISAARQRHHQQHREEHREDQRKILAYINQSMLKVETSHELSMLLHILMHTVFSTIVESYRHLAEDEHYNLEQSIQDLKCKLEWIKSGARKSS